MSSKGQATGKHNESHCVRSGRPDAAGRLPYHTARGYCIRLSFGLYSIHVFDKEDKTK